MKIDDTIVMKDKPLASHIFKTSLTYGKSYKVIDVDSILGVLIKNDLSLLIWYRKNLFITTQEWRKYKINELL